MATPAIYANYDGSSIKYMETFQKFGVPAAQKFVTATSGMDIKTQNGIIEMAAALLVGDRQRLAFHATHSFYYVCGGAGSISVYNAATGSMQHLTDAASKFGLSYVHKTDGSAFDTDDFINTRFAGANFMVFHKDANACDPGSALVFNFNDGNLWLAKETPEVNILQHITMSQANNYVVPTILVYDKLHNSYMPVTLLELFVLGNLFIEVLSNSIIAHAANAQLQLQTPRIAPAPAARPSSSQHTIGYDNYMTGATAPATAAAATTSAEESEDEDDDMSSGAESDYVPSESDTCSSST